MSATITGGFALRGNLVVGGPDVREKTRVLGEALRERLHADCEDLGLPPVEEFRCDLVGDDAAQRGFASGSEPSEGLIRIAAWSSRREPLGVLRKLIPALILNGPPGLAVTGGAPAINEVAAYWPARVPRSSVTARMRILQRGSSGGIECLVDEPVAFSGPTSPKAPLRRPQTTTRPPPEYGVEVPLGAIAHARSGDKGDSVNIGIIGRSEAAFGFLARHLSAGMVADWARGVAEGPVTRYELPGLWALNFVLERALGGGGTRSLLLDPQGKDARPGHPPTPDRDPGPNPRGYRGERRAALVRLPTMKHLDFEAGRTESSV